MDLAVDVGDDREVGVAQVGVDAGAGVVVGDDDVAGLLVPGEHAIGLRALLVETADLRDAVGAAGDQVLEDEEVNVVAGVDAPGGVVDDGVRRISADGRDDVEEEGVAAGLELLDEREGVLDEGAIGEHRGAGEGDIHVVNEGDGQGELAELFVRRVLDKAIEIAVGAAHALDDVALAGDAEADGAGAVAGRDEGDVPERRGAAIALGGVVVVDEAGAQVVLEEVDLLVEGDEDGVRIALRELVGLELA